MPASPEARRLAVFCDFENVALGVREAKYAQFDMEKVLERLLAKGSIVVKKAYCDWERYKEFKAAMHLASFELIEVPHVRQSGKNSADIRMVVDALDLCYTKSHVDTFVIISGDSDFSPLVSKLRENAKTVIGVGVKNSTSDLLIANCDEFIYYDDLVREEETKRRSRRRAAPKKQAAPDAARAKLEDRLQEGIDLPLFHTTHFPSSFYPREAQPGHIVVEESFGAGVIDDLKARGHDVEVAPAWSVGRLTAAERGDDGILRAAATPRLMQAYAIGR